MHAKDSWVWQVQSSQLVLSSAIAKQRIGIAACAQDVDDLHPVAKIAEIDHIILIRGAADIGQQFGPRGAKRCIKLA
jgi:hypothetical protein